jgi:hypothetical protein
MSKPQILRGVPYIVNELSQILAYQPDAEPLILGTVVSPVDPKDPKVIQLHPDWRATAQPFLLAYRESLRVKTEEKLASARTTL